MKITKEFRVHEVRATKFKNVPFTIVLDDNALRHGSESSLTLNADTCARFGIPMSLDLVAHMLECSFESRQLLLEGGRAVKESLDGDDLMINALHKKEERVLQIFYTIPPSTHNEIKRTLELESFGGGDGTHVTILPCPFYRIFLGLTEEEFEGCKALPPASIFRVNFRLA